MITAAAALEAGVAGPVDRIRRSRSARVAGNIVDHLATTTKRCATTAVSVSLEQAFVRSCNTVFAALGMEVGADRLVSMAERFGFNQDIPYDLDVLASAIPDAATFADDPPAIAQNAIGQRDVRATPMQMALVAAGVANGGEIMIPYMSWRMSSPPMERSSTPPNRPCGNGPSAPATASVLTDLMERVVISGTGQRACGPRIPDRRQDGNGRGHGWTATRLVHRLRPGRSGTR